MRNRSSYRTSPRNQIELSKRMDAYLIKRADLAKKYFVNDLPGAVIPATRLQNILENIEQGRPPSESSLVYLLQNGLVALQQFARGEMTYEEFRNIASGEQVLREYSPQTVRKKEDCTIEEIKARGSILKTECEREYQRRESNPQNISKMQNQQLRNRTDFRKCVPAGQTRIDLANKYLVTDLPGAFIPATRLNNVLENLDQGRPLPLEAVKYLQQQGLVNLSRLAQGEITYEAFREIAAQEQASREHALKIKRQKEESARLRMIEEAKAREAIRQADYERERQKRESDPKYIAKIKNQKLRQRYGLDQFIEKEFFARLMDILNRFDVGNRLSDEDILWLTTKGKDYYTEILQTAFHEREAEFYIAEHKRTNDLWNAVNASGHYRKCKQSRKAHELLNSIPATRKMAPKLNSAICTTHGGVMRDLSRFDEALKLGSQAHSLNPKDFRPCTLLGAVNIEMGNYSAGSEWYEKAEERGASQRSIDYDLRGILLRADNDKREKLKAFLLREDPERYKWVRSLKA